MQASNDAGLNQSDINMMLEVARKATDVGSKILMEYYGNLSSYYFLR